MNPLLGSNNYTDMVIGIGAFIGTASLFMLKNQKKEPVSVFTIFGSFDEKNGDMTVEEINSKRKHSITAIRDANLPLNPDRQHQLTNRCSIRQEEISSFISANHEKMPEICKLASKLSIIRMRDLSLGLIGCCKELNAQLDLTQPYDIGFKKGKSQEWVAELALPFLEKMPKGTFEIGIDSTGSTENSKLSTGTTQFVIFDDGSYSGNQLAAVISSFENAAPKGLWSPKCKLYLVIPFVSSPALETIKAAAYRALKTHNKLSITLIKTEKNILSVQDVMPTKAERDRIAGLCEKHCLATPEWKLVDGESMYSMLLSKFYTECTPPYKMI